MGQTWCVVLCLLWWCVRGSANVCLGHNHNRTSCLLASPSCVYSNFSHVCCMDRGLYTCPDLAQGELVENGGVYSAWVFGFWFVFHFFSWSALALSQQAYKIEEVTLD